MKNGQQWFDGDPDDYSGKLNMGCIGLCMDCVHNYTGCVGGNGEEHFLHITEEVARVVTKTSHDDIKKILGKKFPNILNQNQHQDLVE